MAWGTFLAGAFSLGIPMLALRIHAVVAEKEGVTAAILLCAASYAALALVIAGSGMIMGAPVVILVAVSVSVYCELLNDIAQGLMAGSEKHVTGAALMLLRRLLLLSAVLLVGGALGHILEAYFLGSLAILLIPVAYLIRSWSPDAESIRHVLRAARGLWPSAILVNVWSLDVLIANAVLGRAQGGVYAASSRVVYPLNIVAQSLLSVVTPRLAREANERSRQKITRDVRRIATVYGSLLALGSPIAALVITKLFGQDYAGAEPVVIALCCGMGLSAIAQTYVAELLAAGQARTIAFAVTVSTLVGLALLAILGETVGLAYTGLGFLASNAVTIMYFRHIARSQP
jgi:O-antigen/teichoic acid export membrane protein